MYIRDAGDTECKTFKGLEYFYERQGDEWVLLDSAGCGAKEHHIRAFDHYLAHGMGVENRVFDETFGLDFDYEHYLARIAEREGQGLPGEPGHGVSDHGHSHDGGAHNEHS
jgi:hypothetical protein